MTKPTDYTLTNEALSQVRYIAKLIMPVNERTTEVKAALNTAVEDGDLASAVEVLEGNQALYSAKIAFMRRNGVMTPEVLLLAQNLLEKLKRLDLYPKKRRKAA